MTVTDAASQTTRELVIAAAIRLFGRNGYDATSVRQIAREAGGQNVALVSYYFGSKDGLRRACAEAIVARMSSVLPGEGGDTPELDREARALARVDHPNVIAVYEVGEDAGSIFLAMERVDGCTLAEWQRARPRRRRELVELYLQAGRGLAAAHAAGLAHRDFKPEPASAVQALDQARQFAGARPA